TENDNYLLIIITPKGAKYQISSEGDFCDSSDNEIYGLEEIIKEIPVKVICKVEKLFDSFIIWDYTFAKYIEEQYYLRAVKANGYSLKFVKDQTPEICLEAVKTYGGALRHV